MTEMIDITARRVATHPATGDIEFEITAALGRVLVDARGKGPMHPDGRLEQLSPTAGDWDAIRAAVDTAIRDEKIVTAETRLDDLLAWLEENDCDVDSASFERATLLCLQAAFPLRRPSVPLGVLALDVACAAAGRLLPTAVGQSRLPGAAEWRALMNG